jgi:hypothetical protein
MEEGPEPHEWIEKSAEHHQHEHGPEADAKNQMMLAAVTAAVLAVLAALGSLLSGHAANEAILNQTRASDQWAYYQASSTKGHLHEVSRDVVAVLLEAQGAKATPKTEAALENLAQQAKKYDQRKDELKERAEFLEKKSEQQLHQHHRYALGIASFQVGIVLASVSIMVRYRILQLLSLVAGAVGITYVVLGVVGV